MVYANLPKAREIARAERRDVGFELKATLKLKGYALSDVTINDSTALDFGPSYGQIARRDIVDGVTNWYVWVFLGWLDIRQRYRRSFMGPFWLTISMGVTIAALGGLYSLLLKMPTAELLPWMTVGFIIWGFISTTLIDACNCFIVSEGVIKQVHIPLSIQPLRVIWRNLIIMAHNIAILPVVFLIFRIVPNATIFLAIPGLTLIIMNLTWISLLTGMVCTRYRDLPQLIASLIQIGFYVTPIVWKPSALPPAWAQVLTLNPFYHLMTLVQAPLLGSAPAIGSWLFGLGLLLFGSILTLLIYGRFHRRLPYWL